ncbi:hypothetical protein D515_04239 [Grimontia indica]|uniref:Uncharacterized protein n=1 Tax=Grimontia indica TaxID=1056512 RepID=R1IV25_9GAMM|nr:hypothetical protein D515_04239 [Grimontia indica]
MSKQLYKPDFCQFAYIPKQPEDAGFSEFDWRCDRGVPL